MECKIFWLASLRLNQDADFVIRQAYEYAEQHKSKRKLENVVHDLLNHDNFHDEVIEDYVLDILAKRAYPIETKLIELRKA